MLPNLYVMFERRRSLIDKERNHPYQRGKKGQGVLLKSNTVRGQNPADPIFSPDSDLLRDAEAAGSDVGKKEFAPTNEVGTRSEFEGDTEFRYSIIILEKG